MANASRRKKVGSEFDKYLHDELDLMREAANASQLRRNFADSDLLIVPEMYWDYCSPSVIVMERMYGIPSRKPTNCVRRESISVSYHAMVLRSSSLNFP